MTLPTDDRPDLLTVVATMKARPGKEQELRELLEGLIGPTRAEDGNVAYALHQGTQDPSMFFMVEYWTDQAALDAHLGTPHLQAALPRVPDLVDGDLVITPLQRLA